MASWSFRLVTEPFVDYRQIEKTAPGNAVATVADFGLDFPAAGDKKPWEAFVDHVARLNRDGEAAGRRYKVLFLSRHGLGRHNLQERKVGTEAWNADWARRDGDGTDTWADARLVDEGIEQAKALGRTWAEAVETSRVPVPQSLYCSPLARCLETCRLSLGHLFSVRKLPFRPRVREQLRERLWDHTCDKRSPRSWIEKNYPGFEMEQGFAEDDPLWSPDRIETVEAHAARKHKALGRIFESDANQVISLTIHSGAISAILVACGYGELGVAEGSCIVVLVEGTRRA